MKGKITKDGVLCIERAGIMTTQRCRRSVMNLDWRSGTKRSALMDNQYCSCDCPLFGEPEKEKTGYCDTVKEIDEVRLTGRTLLKLCENRTLIFDEFADERQKPPTTGR